MDKFKIQVFEDIDSDLKDIQLYISQLLGKVQGFNIKIECDYKNLKNVKDDIKKECYDLIILDLYDDEDNTPLGYNALKHNTNKIPTVVYTSKGDSIGFDLSSEQNKYPFIVGKLTKSSHGGENIINYLYNYILNEKFGSLCFTPYNDNDLSLKLSLKVLGLNRVNSIVQQINNKNGFENPMLYPMISGLSGAMLFRLNYSNQEYILKLSSEIEKLKIEHENAINLYKKFPDRFLNHIDSHEYFSFDNKVLGFVMKSVENSTTLLEFIITAKSNENIEKKLDDLFLKPQGLKTHYIENKGNKSDWTSIFDKIDESKYLLISKSYDEVRSLVKEYYSDISIEDFRRLTVSNDYSNLNKHKLINDRFKKEKVLSHGDFHAKNILVQDDTYVKIIDTGQIDFNHWSLDISRLIVNLIITGLDKDTVDFFKISSIEKYIIYLNKIMNLEPIPLDDINNKIKIAINWLVCNIRNIYSCSELYEIQLGLMKEFLQISYRFDTTPPNRRAFALIAADLLMKEADLNVIK